AASWSRTHDVSEIVARIEESLDFLNVFMRDVPERHQSLRAAFRHSWNLLDERTRTLYSSLSVFHGGFTSVAAREVVGASESDLLGIVDKSLLYRDASGRYALHQAIRQYALEELE